MKYHRIMAGLAALLLVTGFYSVTASAHVYEILLRPSQLMQKGREHVQVGDSTKAKEYFYTALEHDPSENDMSRIHNGLCVSFIMEENWEDAMKHCNLAIKLRPSNWRFYNNRGNIYLHIGDHEKAIVEYKHGLKLAPSAYVLKRNFKLAELRANGVEISASDFFESLRVNL